MDMSKLKALLVENRVTQTELARLFGRDKSVVTNLLQGKRQLKADEATLIARRLNVSVAEVLGVNEKGGVRDSSLVRFQHAPQHSRGSDQIVEKNGEFYLAEHSGSEKTYALEIKDDALNLAGVLQGDIVISELDAPCKEGQLVVVQHYDKSGARTLVRRLSPPLLEAHSSNKAHKPLHLDKDDVRIVSPVVKLIRLL